MSALGIILLILFVLISLALIFIIAIQSDDSSGLGSLFGGNSDSAFGGQSNKVINKITAYLVAAFIVIAVLVAIATKSSEGSLLKTAQTTVASIANFR